VACQIVSFMAGNASSDQLAARLFGGASASLSSDLNGTLSSNVSNYRRKFCREMAFHAAN
jgi:hypothetical protein